MEERFPGEDGYCDWGLALIDLGHCSCHGCGGHLVDGRCEACGCGHHVQEPTAHVRRRGPAWFPISEPGRCSAADASRATEQREYARRRASATGER